MNTEKLPPGWCIADAQIMAKLRWAEHIFSESLGSIHLRELDAYHRALNDLRSALYSMQWRDREDKK